MMTCEDFDGNEAIIRADRSSFVEIGHALIAIRDGHGYIYAGYGSFFDYCTMRIGIGHRHVDRLIRAAQIAESLQPVGVSPRCERQVRPLAALEPQQQREAWIRAIQTAQDGRVTHRIVEWVVSDIRASSEAIAACHAIRDRLDAALCECEAQGAPTKCGACDG